MKKMNILPLLLVFITLALAPALSVAQVISTVAGVGLGDDSLATKAELLYPLAVARDNAGNRYAGPCQRNLHAAGKRHKWGKESGESSEAIT